MFARVCLPRQANSALRMRRRQATELCSPVRCANRLVRSASTRKAGHTQIRAPGHDLNCAECVWQRVNLSRQQKRDSGRLDSGKRGPWPRAEERGSCLHLLVRLSRSATTSGLETFAQRTISSIANLIIAALELVSRAAAHWLTPRWPGRHGTLARPMIWMRTTDKAD